MLLFTPEGIRWPQKGLREVNLCLRLQMMQEGTHCSFVYASVTKRVCPKLKIITYSHFLLPIASHLVGNAVSVGTNLLS